MIEFNQSTSETKIIMIPLASQSKTALFLMSVFPEIMVNGPIFNCGKSDRKNGIYTKKAGANVTSLVLNQVLRYCAAICLTPAIHRTS